MGTFQLIGTLALLSLPLLASARTEIRRTPRETGGEVGAGASEDRRPCSSPDEAYDERSKKCYRTSSYDTPVQGPCPPRKIFVRQDRDESLGECICGRPYQKCSRPLILWPKDNSCQELFTQGPCGDEQWLVLGVNNSATCEENICRKAPIPSIVPAGDFRFHGEVFHFAHQGKCYTTELQAHCPHNHVARFVYDNQNPTCYKPEDKVCGEW